MSLDLEVQNKQPADVLYYDVSYAKFLQHYGGDVLSSLTILVDDEPIVVGGVEVGLRQPAQRTPQIVDEGRVARVWVEAGEPTADYKVSVRAATAGGLTKEYDFIVSVKGQ